MGVRQQSRVWKSVARAAGAGEERLNQFEIAHRHLVEFQMLGALVEAQGVDVRAASFFWVVRT